VKLFLSFVPFQIFKWMRRHSREPPSLRFHLFELDLEYSNSIAIQPMNKAKMIFLTLAACLGALSTAYSQITVVKTFDYHGYSTTPHGLNDLDQVTGSYVDPTGVTYSFLRLPNGSFPHVHDFYGGDSFYSRGINNSQMFTGYLIAPNGIFAIIITGRQTSDTQFCGGDSYFYGINNDGDVVGAAQCPGETARVPACIINGGLTPCSNPPNSNGAEANGINISDQVVGEYFDPPPATSFHGYLQSALGTLTYPIDYPGAASTTLLAINDKGSVVGQWFDGAGAGHGFAGNLPNHFVSFDYPGATATALVGINNFRTICGYYTDSAGLNHGFLARLGN
jgi:uncharacterized membrane protein